MPGIQSLKLIHKSTFSNATERKILEGHIVLSVPLLRVEKSTLVKTLN